MESHSSLPELLEFPCDYQFKAFGPNDEDGGFSQAVRAAVATVVPVSLDAMKIRPSSKGAYQCVSVLVRLHNAEQLKEIYAALRRVQGLKFLL